MVDLNSHPLGEKNGNKWKETSVSQLKHPLEIIATYPSHKARCFIGQLCLVPGTCFMPSRSPRRGHEAKGSVGYFFSPFNSELLNPHFISIDEHVWHKLNTSLIQQVRYSIQNTFWSSQVQDRATWHSSRVPLLYFCFLGKMPLSILSSFLSHQKVWINLCELDCVFSLLFVFLVRNSWLLVLLAWLLGCWLQLLA